MTFQQYVNSYAQQHGMELNPNMDVVLGVLASLDKTAGFCPCVPKHQWHHETICPCEQMRNFRNCRCGLFVRPGHRTAEEKKAEQEDPDASLFEKA